MTRLILRIGFNPSYHLLLRIKLGWYKMIFPKEQRLEKWL
jgi:hypothetical protein